MPRPKNPGTSTIIPEWQVPAEVTRVVQEGDSFDFINDTGVVIPGGVPIQRNFLQGWTRRPIAVDGDGAAFVVHSHTREIANGGVVGAYDTWEMGELVFIDLVNGVAHKGPVDPANGIVFGGLAIPRWGQHASPTQTGGIYEQFNAADVDDACLRFLVRDPLAIAVAIDYPVLYPAATYPADPNVVINAKP